MFVTGFENYTVQCDRCYTEGPCAGSENDAIKWWSRAGKMSPAQVKQMIAHRNAAEKAAILEQQKAEMKEKTEKTAAADADRKWVSEREKWLRAPINPDESSH